MNKIFIYYIMNPNDEDYDPDNIQNTYRIVDSNKPNNLKYILNPDKKKHT